MAYLYLAIAICFEVLASSSLKASNEFKEWLPSLITVIGYLGAFYFMTLSMRYLTLATVYASWSGLGIVLVSIIGVVFYKEKLDLAAIAGMTLIIAGVLVMNLLSKTNVH